MTISTFSFKKTLLSTSSEANTHAGILRCTRYAFGPNRLHYCGPDANREILAYVQHGASDPGLESLLRAFETMYPYLARIAESNGIRNPFDKRVVEAYWIGNSLLEKVSKKDLYKNLVDDHRLKKKIGLKSFSHIEAKIDAGAIPHHSFHVLNIWKRTGHLNDMHTLESMEECRISHGKITSINDPFLEVESEPLILRDGKLVLGSPAKRKIIRHLDSPRSMESLKIGDTISIHWGVPCEILTDKEIKKLRKYTQKSIDLANTIIARL